MRVVEVGQYLDTKDTGEPYTTSNSGFVANTPLPRDDQSFSTKRVDPRKYEKLDLCWKSRPVFSISSMELKFELSPVNKDTSHSWVRISYGTVKYVIDSIQGQNRNSCRSTRRANSTNKHPGWLQPGQRQKQNHNREYSLVRQQPYQYMKEDGLTLNHQNKILPRTIFRRK